MNKNILVKGLYGKTEVLFEENIVVLFSFVKMEEVSSLNASVSIQELEHISIPEIIVAIFSFTDYAFKEYCYSAIDINIVNDEVSVLFDFDSDVEDVIHELENNTQEISEVSIFSSEEDEEEDSLFEVYHYDDIVIVKFPKELMEDENIDTRIQIAVSDIFSNENILTSFDAIETSSDMIFFYEIDNNPELVIGNFDPVTVNQSEDFIVNIVPSEDGENYISIDARFSISEDCLSIAINTEILYGLGIENVQIINFLKNLAEDILDVDVSYIDLFCDIDSVGVVLEFDSELVEEISILSDIVYAVPDLDFDFTDDAGDLSTWQIPVVVSDLNEIEDISVLEVFSSKDDYSIVCSVKGDDIPDLVNIENISDIIEYALNQNIINGCVSIANTGVIADENIYIFDIIENPDVYESEFYDDEDDSIGENKDIKG